MQMVASKNSRGESGINITSSAPSTVNEWSQVTIPDGCIQHHEDDTRGYSIPCNYVQAGNETPAQEVLDFVKTFISK